VAIWSEAQRRSTEKKNREEEQRRRTEKKNREEESEKETSVCYDGAKTTTA
jgi:type IV secretory pathway VirB9-like protein